MLEIIILYKLAKRIGVIVAEKGHRKGGFQLMLVAMWFGGEIFGAFFGGVLGAIAMQAEGPAQLLGYAFALLCAIIGAVIAFQIAKNLEPVNGNEAALDLQQVDLERLNEPFRPNDPASRVPDDRYTERPERRQRPADDRIQLPGDRIQH